MPPRPEKKSAPPGALFTSWRLPNLKSLWMLVAGFLFSCMGIFVKVGSEHFSSAELVFYRSVFGLAILYAIVVVRRLPLGTRHFRNHAWRGLTGMVALLLFFHTISILPLATAITLNYTSPLFFAFLMVVVLGERPRPLLIAALLSGFGGVVLLLQPGFQQELWRTQLLGLLAGGLSGFAYLNVKQLGKLGEPDWRVVFYFTLISSLGSALWMSGKTWHTIGWNEAWILLGLGVTATLAQLALTRAHHEGDSLVVGALAYSTVIFASLWGVLLWQEVLSWQEWAAIAIIVLSGIVAARAASRAAVEQD